VRTWKTLCILLCCVSTALASCSDEPPSKASIAAGQTATIVSDTVLGCANPDSWTRLRASKGERFASLLSNYVEKRECMVIPKGPVHIINKDTFGRLVQIRSFGQEGEWWIISSTVDRT
jgi:hypothetical protein